MLVLGNEKDHISERLEDDICRTPGLMENPHLSTKFLIYLLGKRASVGYEDGTLKVWDLRQGMHTFHLSGTGNYSPCRLVTYSSLTNY